MKTARFYVENWLCNKPPGLHSYLIFNLHRKREICYLFRLRSESTAAMKTLYDRDKQRDTPFVLYVNKQMNLSNIY